MKEILLYRAFETLYVTVTVESGYFEVIEIKKRTPNYLKFELSGYIKKRD